MEHPTFGNGKICYIEIPCNDINVSAEFYKDVFGWEIRSSENGMLSFDDAVGEVSGTWVIGPRPSTEPGILISIMVDNMDATIKLVTDSGGKIVQAHNSHSKEKIARFSDPFGNVFGLYQQQG